MAKHIQLFEEFNSKISKIDWVEADKKIPIFSSFGVTDAETGKSWTMMRTSGKLHADVEPITKKDGKQVQNSK